MYKQHTGIDAYPLEFTGSGSEYFRVWIVNVLLTVVTFGLYTPFARRRTAQYFWGHTIVAGSPLEFTAQQKKMVIGFLLMVGLYAAFNIASETEQDVVVGIMLLAATAFSPYIWGSAMRFRLNNTRWRGVRLQFAARWSEVYRASWPVFAIAAVWFVAAMGIEGLVPKDAEGKLARPVPAYVFAAFFGTVLAVLVATVLCIIRLEFNYKSLLVARGRIGGQVGRWKPVFGDFVRIWGATVGMFLLTVLLVTAVVAALVFAGIFGEMRGEGRFALLVVGALLGFFLVFFGSAPALAYREARMFHLVWNNIGISRIARFKSDLSVWGYVRLRTINVVLTLLTLGFYRPFALISQYRMKANSVTLHVKGSLDQLAGQLAREEQGFADAIADAAGLDLVG